MTTTQDQTIASLGSYKFGWADSDVAGATAQRGINPDVVRNISALKSEPEWMLKMRLRGLSLFEKKPMPTWGSDLSGIDFDNIKYFVRSSEKQATSWEDLPEDIKNTYDKLGIPEAEKQRLVAGVAAQYESEVVYHQLREDLEAQGVIFLDTDTALKEHPEIFEEYFGSVIPVGDNKFASLNTAVWSGGSFVYVPKGVHVEIPLQAYFRIEDHDTPRQMGGTMFLPGSHLRRIHETFIGRYQNFVNQVPIACKAAPAPMPERSRMSGLSMAPAESTTSRDGRSTQPWPFRCTRTQVALTLILGSRIFLVSASIFHSSFV